MTWGMARLAMVRPEMRSERRSLRLYWEPHSKIGKKYWRVRRNFLKEGWFLKRCKGSSGKNISESLCLSLLSNVLSGGKRTWWIGISVWVLIVISSKCSTLLQFIPILKSSIFSFVLFSFLSTSYSFL